MTDSQTSPSDTRAGAVSAVSSLDAPARDSAQQDFETTLQRAEAVLDAQPAHGRKRWITRAPGRLDVIGGFAEYSGATVIGTPLAGGVNVTVQLRDDSRIAIFGLGQFAGFDGQPITFELAGLDAKAPAEFAQELPDVLWVRAAAGAIVAMLVTGKIEDGAPGATIVIDSRIPALIDAGVTASVAVAVLTALIAAWDLRFDPAECAQLAVRADNEVVGFPCGPGSALTVLHAHRGGLTPVNCRTGTVEKVLALPEDLVLVGVDCGVKYPDANRRYIRARSAAFMGRVLIDRIIQAFDLQGIQWNGILAQMPVAGYVDRLRDRIPIKIKGADFISRFGQTSDALTSIEPDITYKIRSRTEHHIYEADRSLRFAEHFARLSKRRDRDLLIKAGELMYASHWSYGQRCGLGSIETDRLVTLLRQRGPDAGIFGARISGQGAGGIVVVLMDNSPTARNALQDAIHEYERVVSTKTSILEGTSCGALEFGLRQV